MLTVNWLTVCKRSTTISFSIATQTLVIGRDGFILFDGKIDIHRKVIKTAADLVLVAITGVITLRLVSRFTVDARAAVTFAYIQSAAEHIQLSVIFGDSCRSILVQRSDSHSLYKTQCTSR